MHSAQSYVKELKHIRHMNRRQTTKRFQLHDKTNTMAGNFGHALDHNHMR